MRGERMRGDLAKIITMIVTSLVLAGCAGPWVRLGATPADLARDQSQCDYEASLATAPISNAVESGMKQGLLTVDCMKAKGWQR